MNKNLSGINLHNHHKTPIIDHLVFLYGEKASQQIYPRLMTLLESYLPYLTQTQRSGGDMQWLSQTDSVLITYPDQIQEQGIPTLRTLADFCETHLTSLISGIHLLPFYPWSTDDGFSVIDYLEVDPRYGSWEDINGLKNNFYMMFDAVINHVSVQNKWFQKYLLDDAAYQNYFITIRGTPDLKKVVRPRALPLLTEFCTPSGNKNVWTTFSTDQVDLNYTEPSVLLEIIETLLFYAARGAELIRLDAIAYLWKEIGTTCIHLPQTHRIIQLFRELFNIAAPRVLMITETNVPHDENISYFGKGTDEAQLVYNFALPPLVLHTLHTGNSTALSRWAANLTLPPGPVTFFNFLASHDGIGLNPVRGILSETDIQDMIDKVCHYGGLVSYKNMGDGSRVPYELNINYFDALSDQAGNEPLSKQVDRFMAAQAVMLSFVGLPGIYFHSLFGSRGWPEGVQLTGRNRTINRQKLMRANLDWELNDTQSVRYQVFQRYKWLLQARAGCSAFHPYGGQRVIDCGDSIFALLRYSPDHSQELLYIQNVTSQPQWVPIDIGRIAPTTIHKTHFKDLITNNFYTSSQLEQILLEPYQIMWLKIA